MIKSTLAGHRALSVGVSVIFVSFIGGVSLIVMFVPSSEVRVSRRCLSH